MTRDYQKIAIVRAAIRFSTFQNADDMLPGLDLLRRLESDQEPLPDHLEWFKRFCEAPTREPPHA